MNPNGCSPFPVPLIDLLERDRNTSLFPVPFLGTHTGQNHEEQEHLPLSLAGLKTAGMKQEPLPSTTKGKVGDRLQDRKPHEPNREKAETKKDHGKMAEFFRNKTVRSTPQRTRLSLSEIPGKSVGTVGTVL